MCIVGCERPDRIQPCGALRRADADLEWSLASTCTKIHMSTNSRHVNWAFLEDEGGWLRGEMFGVARNLPSGRVVDRGSREVDSRVHGKSGRSRQQPRKWDAPYHARKRAGLRAMFGTDRLRQRAASRIAWQKCTQVCRRTSRPVATKIWFTGRKSIRRSSGSRIRISLAGTAVCR